MKIEDYRKMKKYGEGALKRKLGIKATDKVEAGTMISKANKIKKMNPRKRMAFMGLV